MPTESPIKHQLEFAERCFTNAQELIRFIDQKTGYLLAAVGILTAIMGVLVTRIAEIKPEGDWQNISLAIGGGLILLFFILAFVIICLSPIVLRARSHTSCPNRRAKGLIFPLMILNACPSELQYADELISATPEQLLDEYASQVVTLSQIFRIKQAYLNKILCCFFTMAFVWAAAIAVLVPVLLYG